MTFVFRSETTAFIWTMFPDSFFKVIRHADIENRPGMIG